MKHEDELKILEELRKDADANNSDLLIIHAYGKNSGDPDHVKGCCEVMNNINDHENMVVALASIIKTNDAFAELFITAVHLAAESGEHLKFTRIDKEDFINETTNEKAN